MSHALIQRAVLLLAVVSAGTTQAQSRQFSSFQVSGLLTTLSGESFDNYRFGSALGLEAQFRISPSDFTLGGGVQLSSGGSTGVGLDNKLSMVGIFLEPRYLVSISSRVVRPYLAGRAAILKLNLDADQGQIVDKRKTSGFAFGAGGGFIARLSDKVNLDLGLAFTRGSFGEYRERADGTLTGIEAGSGSSLVVKVGLNLGLGN